MDTQIAEAPVAPAAEAAPAAPKKRGRPPGSKNKPKAAPVAVAEGAPAVASDAPAAEGAEAEEAKRGGHLVTISNIKAVVKGLEANMSGDFIEALEDYVKDVICDAYNRAAANSRKTLRPCDL